MKKPTPGRPAKSKASMRPARVSTAPSPPAEEQRYRAQDALRTLSRAEEIKADSKLMRDVKAEAQRQMQATQ